MALQLLEVQAYGFFIAVTAVGELISQMQSEHPKAPQLIASGSVSQGARIALVSVNCLLCSKEPSVAISLQLTFSLT